MIFHKYISIFLLSTVKFMFTPLLGPVRELSFMETYFLAVSGGVTSAAFFYFLSEYFMRKNRVKQLKRNRSQTDTGENIKVKKRITWRNRTIVKVKSSIGYLGLSIWAPFFLSVPLGSIVVAKFFRHKKGTFLLICLGMVLNGFIMTSIAYYLL